MNRRFLAIGATIALIFAAQPAFADSTSSNPDPGSQSPMPSDLNEFTVEIASSIPDASQVWNASKQTLQVYVSDNTEQELAHSLAQQSSARTPVEVLVAAHSLHDLSQKAAKVVGTTSSSGDVVWASPRPDGSGIVAGVTPHLARSAPDSRYGDVVGDLPVDFEQEDVAPEPAGRNDDSLGYKIAGMSMSSPIPGEEDLYSICSTAFSVQSQSGNPLLLTANHCSDSSGNGAAWRVGLGSSGSLIGVMDNSALYDKNGNLLDIATLSGGAGGYRGSVFWGNEESNETKSVLSAKAPVINDVVAYSGSQSGTTYGSTIKATNVTVDYRGSNKTYGGLVMTKKDGGNGAVGNGDSGGPVTIPTSGDVLAVGVISGMSGNEANCSGKPATSSRRCSNDAFFAPVTSYFAAYGGRLSSPN